MEWYMEYNFVQFFFYTFGQVLSNSIVNSKSIKLWLNLISKVELVTVVSISSPWFSIMRFSFERLIWIRSMYQYIFNWLYCYLCAISLKNLMMKHLIRYTCRVTRSIHLFCYTIYLLITPLLTSGYFAINMPISMPLVQNAQIADFLCLLNKVDKNWKIYHIKTWSMILFVKTYIDW